MQFHSAILRCWSKPILLCHTKPILLCRTNSISLRNFTLLEQTILLCCTNPILLCHTNPISLHNFTLPHQCNFTPQFYSATPIQFHSAILLCHTNPISLSNFTPPEQTNFTLTLHIASANMTTDNVKNNYGTPPDPTALHWTNHCTLPLQKWPLVMNKFFHDTPPDPTAHCLCKHDHQWCKFFYDTPPDQQLHTTSPPISRISATHCLCKPKCLPVATKYERGA